LVLQFGRRQRPKKLNPPVLTRKRLWQGAGGFVVFISVAPRHTAVDTFPISEAPVAAGASGLWAAPSILCSCLYVGLDHFFQRALGLQDVFHGIARGAVAAE
jgi:hypothetical protein